MFIKYFVTVLFEEYCIENINNDNNIIIMIHTYMHTVHWDSKMALIKCTTLRG